MEQSIYYWILDIGIMYRKGGRRNGLWRIGERKELRREVDFWLSVLDMIAEERMGNDCSERFWKEFTALCKRGKCPNYQRILQKKEDILYCRPPEFTVTQSEMYMAGGMQSEHTVNLIGVQYKLQRCIYTR